MKTIEGEHIDNIGYYENVLTDEMCDKLVEWGKDKEDILSIGEAITDDLAQEIYSVMHSAINENLKSYIKEFEINSFPDDFGIEPFHIKGFSPDEENEFQYQIDVGNYDMARRFLGIFFVLNDAEEPGEIKFYRQGTVVSPKKGSAFVYPSLWTHPQMKVLPKKGIEYFLGTYLHYI